MNGVRFDPGDVKVAIQWFVVLPEKAEFSYRIFDPRKDLNAQLEAEDMGGQGRRISPRNGKIPAGPRGNSASHELGRQLFVT